MSAQTPEAVARTWFEEVWNQGRVDAIQRLFAADCVARGLPGGDMHGPAAFEALFHLFRGAFPDIHIAVEQTITQGEWVAVVCQVTGTHTGNTMGPATGKAVNFQGITLARVAGGQIHEGRNCFDFLTMYQQLGLVPAPIGA
jgi:steroid delta-isomerase-like uncharacterized protein